VDHTQAYAQPLDIVLLNQALEMRLGACADSDHDLHSNDLRCNGMPTV
jgi:hypothetical protein